MKILTVFLFISTFALSSSPKCIGRDLFPPILKKLDSYSFAGCKKKPSTNFLEMYECANVNYELNCRYLNNPMLLVRVTYNDLLNPVGHITEKFVEEMGSFLKKLVTTQFSVTCEEAIKAPHRDQYVAYTCRRSAKVYYLQVPKVIAYGSFWFVFQEKK